MIEIIETGETTQDEIDKIDSKFNTKHFYSRMSFLSDHNGLRKGELSTLTGTYGSSKSTLTRTIIAELAMAHKKVFVFLSEESSSIYNFPLSNAMTNMADLNYANKSLKNVSYLSQTEMNQNDKNLNHLLSCFADMAKFHSVEVFIIDNFTTSFLGDSTISEQARASELLKKFAIQFDVVVLVILHTKKNTDVYTNFLTGDDVRGNQTIINMSSYSYMLTLFSIGNDKRAFIHVDKARYHKKSHKKFYELCFDSDIEMYVADTLSSKINMKGIMNRIKKEMQNV